MKRVIIAAVGMLFVTTTSHSEEITIPNLLGRPSHSITFSAPEGEIVTIYPDGSVRFGPAFKTTEQMAKDTIRIIAETYGKSLYNCPGITFKGD